MSNKGCTRGCIHRKEIKLEQMKSKYEFRCTALKRYITKDEIKYRCSLFQGHLKIKQYTIDEFID